MDETRSHDTGRDDDVGARASASADGDEGESGDGLLAAFTHLGVCVIGTHDPRRAADAWRELMDRRRGHATAPGVESAGRRLDASAWWHAQHRWARRGRRGWVLVRDRADGTEPAMVLVGVYRD